MINSYSQFFTFNGVNCGDKGYEIVSFDDYVSGFNKVKAGGVATYETTKTYSSKHNVIIGKKYDDVLVFKIQIHKIDETPISTENQRQLSRFLDTNDYQILSFSDENLAGLYFKAIVSDRQVIGINGNIYGYEITFTCDSLFGYSKEYTTTIAATDGGTYTFIDDSDEIDETYPEIKITIGTAGTFSIANSMTGKTVEFNNCTVGEVITIDGEKNNMSSSTRGSAIYQLENFNYNWFSFANTYSSRENVLTFVGSATVEMKYRFLRKAAI